MRVTRVGRVLRMTHLDELPQLWNVLKGEMSVVGPRPERPEFIPMLEEAIPFFSRRLLIKPGVTGWASSRSDYSSDAEGAASKLSYDLWYLRHRNLLVDLAICARRSPRCCSGRAGESVEAAEQIREKALPMYVETITPRPASQSWPARGTSSSARCRARARSCSTPGCSSGGATTVAARTRRPRRVPGSASSERSRSARGAVPACG